MRIGELSQATGVSVASIKYYIREGLLPAGELMARTQAEYGDAHVSRLELIRALRDGAGMSVATMGRVFAALDGGRWDDLERWPEYLTIATGALSAPVELADGEREEFAAADGLVAGLMEDLGWAVKPDWPGLHELATAVMQVRRYLPGLVERPEDLAAHARAVRQLAEVEIPEDYDPSGDPENALRLAVLGTVLFEPVLLALRRLAHIDRVAEVTSPSER